MKFKHIIILALITLMGSTETFSQLSERVNDSSVIRIGTRPQEGDFGFYVSTSYQEIEEMTDRDIEITGIPLVNLKYYYSDNIVFGLGIKSYKSKKYLSGKLPSDETGPINDINIESRNIFSPRAEYHFAESNIFDVYVGVQFPLGWEKEIVETGEKYNIAGDYQNDRVTKSCFIYGYSFFTGIQTFIADLPMAIGFEVGIRGFGYGDLTFKHEESYSINGEEYSQTYYTSGNDNNITYTEYKELEYKEFDLGSDFRITFNYFFSR